MNTRFLAIAAALAIGATAAGAGAQEPDEAHDHAANQLDGPVVSGVPAPGVRTVTWVDDVENLTYSNPFGQNIGPVWYQGRIGFAIHGGEIWIDPERTSWANQYMPVYSLDGGPDGGPEPVEGQHIIYDTAPGDEGYSPIWRHHWVIVPRDYDPNALRSVAAVRDAGYEIVTTDRYFN